jgi:rhodanese-related sulfurtransferase
MNMIINKSVIALQRKKIHMKLLIIIMLLFSIMIFNSCSTEDVSPSMTLEPPAQIENNAVTEYRKISAEEAYQMMQDSDEYILLDVRTNEEYKEKRIDGAILIPDYEIGNRAEIELPEKDALIFLYCRSGRRSANAAHYLIGMGYTNVYDFGGIIDWPYDTVNG